MAQFPTITLAGTILTAEKLDALGERETPGQRAGDFGLPSGARVRDEILRAWDDARNQWQVFQSRRARLPEGATGTTETRRFWIEPLLNVLGYDLELATAEDVDGKSYAVSHRDPFDLPVHIAGFGQKLDDKRGTGLRLSAHGLVQEYLNATDHLYGVVTNGLRLRLLRDASRLTRLSFVEFDLEGMMEDLAYADFAVLYRLLHRSRMPATPDEAAASWLERYHQDSLEEGSAIRGKLSDAVERGMRDLANGLLKRPENSALRQALADGTLSEADLFAALLRFVYRMLFLLVVESRDLVYGADADGETAGGTSFRTVYNRFYAVSRLRDLVEARHLVDGRKADLWTRLFETFRLFETDDEARALGLAALDGELFGTGALDALAGTSLDNDTLLNALGRLFRFKNERGDWVRVSYRSLNVEEFGSVYQGLLDLAPHVTPGNDPEHPMGWAFGFTASDERSKSGTHYTPDELVRPLVEHGLDPVIERALDDAAEQHGIENRQNVPEMPEADRLKLAEAVLALKVCDPACGSGHFLLAAGRRLAWYLARLRTGEEFNLGAQREAFRDVATRCLYGVDVNPMAVELCKVALWLEAHQPGFPLSFLDHRIRTGNAVVGLARPEELDEGIPDQAFKTLPGDDKDVASTLRKRNKGERKQRHQGVKLQLALGDTVEDGVGKLATQFRQLDDMEDDTLAGRQAKRQAFEAVQGAAWLRWKRLADAAVAPFFQRKTLDTRGLVPTDGMLRRAMNEANPQHQWLAATTGTAAEKRVFHWFLEFPEVMDAGGFDCILGNPPFLGGTIISTNFGTDTLNWLKTEFHPAGNRCDLSGYFFRRIFDLLKSRGTSALIATNTISQGDTREGGLDVIVSEGGSIPFAVRSMKWPGEATLDISLISVHKSKWNGPYYLDGYEVPNISSYLWGEEDSTGPHRLSSNAELSFNGSYVHGLGFVLDPTEALSMISADPTSSEVVKPYIIGDDINSRPDTSPSRWVIDFRDRTESEARNFPAPYAHAELEVKPIRQKTRKDGSYKLRKPLPQRWWQHADKRPALYKAISSLSEVVTCSIVSKHMAFVMTGTGKVFSHRNQVFVFSSYREFAVLQSTIHEVWARRYSSTLETRLNYAASDCFETFPLPGSSSEGSSGMLGERYHADRAELMLDLDLGLTKLYNFFHTPDLTPSGVASAYAKKDRPEVDTLAAYPARIEALRQLHRQMDEAVARAYGWGDLDLGHGFHDVDFLPEKDRVRYTISPEARREVLKRLLLLNHERHAKEVAAGLA